LLDNLGPMLLLFVVAVIGKGLGSFLPVVKRLRLPSALAFSLALMPRAEITLLVMQRGLDLGVLSQDAYGVVVGVVVLTMVGVPLVLRLMMPTAATT
jgi:Sodium/hydrogen exchanger family.